jgi:lipopolysaccharide/colanic/teichoic acid biosynthesis glycosyltransferase/cellulose synthase/poly-beta-1,6-N-acetylglucosamine synthase-like glycosyltransferase
MEATLIINIVLFIITLAALALFAAPYVVYPVLMRRVRARAFGGGGNGASKADANVSVIVPAYNEQEHISAKVAELIEQRGSEARAEILVVSDGSTDDTVIVARAAAKQSKDVRVVEFLENYGKWSVLEHAVSLATGDILVFTDASARLSPGALDAMVNAFEDPEVGVVTSTYGVLEDGPEAAYWDRKRALIEDEARRDLLLGAHGACWAIRREALDFGDAPMIHDDFVLALRARIEGWRVAVAPDAVAMDAPTEDLATNFRRWVRVAQGNLQMLSGYRQHVKNPELFDVTATLALTKLFKTLGPIWIMTALFASLGVAVSYPVLALVVGAAVLAISSAMLAAGKGEALLFGLVAQVATGIGVARSVMGLPARWGTSDPGRSSEPAVLPGMVRAAKRALDITAAAIGLLLSAPILAVCSILIRAESKGDAIFAQERVARVHQGHEEVFTMYKLRTMYIDAEARSGPVWACDNDPRITRVGRLLRKLRLDELPQLYNVLRGDMSLVGPRPERPHFTSRLRGLIPGYDDRVSALKPGITGLAQIRCGYDTSIDSVREKILHDLTYAAHLYSLPTYLRLEVRILLETVVVALTGRGSK